MGHPVDPPNLAGISSFSDIHQRSFVGCHESMTGLVMVVIVMAMINAVAVMMTMMGLATLVERPAIQTELVHLVCGHLHIATQPDFHI